MGEDQELGEEFDVEQPAGDEFQVERVLSPFSRAISARISRTSPASRRRSRGLAARGDARRSPRQRRVAGDDARARQRHVLPGLGLLALIVRRRRCVASGPWRPEGRSRRSTS